jgi:hypothetical protein
MLAIQLAREMSAQHTGARHSTGVRQLEDDDPLLNPTRAPGHTVVLTLHRRLSFEPKDGSTEDTMNRKMTTGFAFALSLLSFAGNGAAQTRDTATQQPSSKDLSPTTHNVELTIGTGYEQAFGKFSADQPSLTDIGQAGGAVQIGVGYRLIPELTLGVFASGAMFGRGDQVDSSANLFSSTAGFQADWHFLPGGHELDPWVSLGSGWRGYWINENAGNVSLQGIELAKLQVGVDYRIERAVSISPVVGADLSTFLTQSVPGSDGFHNISNPHVNTFLFAGMMGRFDIPTGADHPQIASR